MWNGGEVQQTTRVNAMIVDDHPGYRAGLVALLSHDLRVSSVHEAASVSSALALARSQHFDLFTVDVLIPETGGIALVRELRALQPECKILALSMIDEPVRVAEMLRAGATGYAFKSQPVDDILPAVHRVLEGERYLPPHFSPEETEDSTLARLTARERAVFDLLVRGFRSQRVADELSVARRTIDTHRRHIMQKLGARSIVDLIKLAMRHGTLEP